MERNPYAAPAAIVDDLRTARDDDLESRKASRGKRLGAVLLDYLASLLCVGTAIIAAVMESSARKAGMPGSSVAGLLLFVGLAALLALVVVNFVMIHRSGQTIGKRIVDIAIVRSDGSRMGLLRYIFIRCLPVGLLGAIPYVGWLVSLLDPLLIFGKERRCLHDLIADTIVVDA